VSRTYRNTESLDRKPYGFRKPKRNGAIKGMVRSKALPPDSWEDTHCAGIEEDWFGDHDHQEMGSRDFHKNQRKLRKEGILRKQGDWK